MADSKVVDCMLDTMRAVAVEAKVPFRGVSFRGRFVSGDAGGSMDAMPNAICLV